MACHDVSGSKAARAHGLKVLLHEVLNLSHAAPKAARTHVRLVLLHEVLDLSLSVECKERWRELGLLHEGLNHVLADGLRFRQPPTGVASGE